MRKRVYVLTGALFTVAVLIIGSVVLAVVGLAMGWFSLFGLEHPKREVARLEAQYGEEVRALQTLAQALLQYHQQDLARARAALPAEAPIAAEWDFHTAVAGIGQGYDQELLGELRRAYLANPYNLLDTCNGALADKLESLAQHPDRLTRIEQQLVAVRDDSCALRAWYEGYLDNLPLLAELEYALSHGLIDLRLHEPAVEPGIDAYGSRSVALALLEARTVQYGLRGEDVRALDLLEDLYDLAQRARETAPLFEAPWAWLQTYRIDRVLALLADHLDWTPEQAVRFRKYFNLSAEDLARQLMLYAAQPPSDPIYQQFPMSVNMEHVTLDRMAVATHIGMLLPESPELVERLRDAEQLEDEHGKIASMFRFATSGFTDIAISLGRGEVTHTASVMVRATAREPLFDLVSDLERYREKHGRYPSRLDELSSYEQHSGIAGYEASGEGFTVRTDSPRYAWSVPSLRFCE